MKKNFFEGTTRGVRIAFGGFVIAFLGVVAGFLGFYVSERWLSKIGLVVTVVGVLVGFIGIAYGWLHDAIPAIRGSFKAAKELRTRLLSRKR